MNFRIDFRKTRNILIILALLVAMLYYGRVVFIPVTISMILSLLLLPLTRSLEARNIPKIPAILITFLLVIMIFTGLGLFFSSEIIQLFDSIQTFGKNLSLLFARIRNLFFASLPLDSERLNDLYNRSTQGLLDTSGSLLGRFLSSSTIFLANTGLVLIFTFLFLLYRGSFKKFILYHFPRPEHPLVIDLLNKIQRVAQNYFMGVFIVTIFMGFMNSIGLLLIGIDHPFLFGFLGALLTIIPYIGTFIGGLIPTLYALVNYDDPWKPVWVIILYIFVQILEGNFITPKIVGNKVSLNPFFAIIALILGELIWGIAGMILFIPVFAMIKVILDQVPGMEPYGALLGSEFPTRSNFMFSNISLPRIFKRRSV